MSPPGRYAHWVNWKIMGFTKEGWQAMHTVFSYTFVILSIFHLFTINWRAFLSYLKTKKQNGLNKKREFYLSTFLILIFFFGTIFSIQPFKSVMDFGEYLTESWESAEQEPPIPHAELLTLAELAEQMKLSSVDEITQKLNKFEIKFDNVNHQTLLEIAENNNTTPITIYEQLKQKPASQQQGMGIGKKTLEEFAAEVGKSSEDVLKILEEKGIKADKSQTLRQIGDQNNMPPKDIYELFKQ
jgi:hypothetical protein